MGQLLSEPVTTKNTSSLENSQFKVGSSAMQGWRVGMEDAHCHFLPLEEDPEASFFAVFDGHGGDRVAHHVKEHLPKKITSTEAYQSGDVVSAFKEGFIAMDWEMMDDPAFKVELSGTTAICVLVKGGRLYCGNVGDSRAIASVDGAVKELSTDHKPTRKDEQSRIIEAGGWVESSRVNGNLALSRAIGDFGYKVREKAPELQVISAFPDIEEIEVTEDLEFVLIACDGIWDCLRNNQVLDFVRTRIGEGKEPAQICEELLTKCLAPYSRGVQTGTDNMTVILVTFLHGKPYADLVQRCRVLSEAQQSARKGLSLADILDSSDDEDPPTPPPRPPHMLSPNQEGIKPPEREENDNESLTRVEDEKEKEGVIVNGGDSKAESVSPASSTDSKGQTAASELSNDIN